MDEKQLALLEKEVEENPKSVFAHHRLAIAYWQAGKLEEAVKAFRRLFELDPPNFEARINFGTLLAQMGHLEEAKKQFEYALKSYPSSPEALINLGLVHLHLGELEQAKECYLKALEALEKMKAHPELTEKKKVKIDASEISLLVNLSTIYVEEGDFEKAIECCRKALEKDPNLALAYNNMAVALYYAGRHEEARKALQKAKELGYPVPEELEKMIMGQDGQG
ncbi:MAG: tetratricopeptide repeat protein [Thermodesulfobacteria bacterium]|nr:tetratricopeptide repeat protein [Thermodesulfobacteriota bacterium]